MNRHRWVPIDDTAAVRHKGRCFHCGLERQRKPGNNPTFYFQREGVRLIPVYAAVVGRTPPCPGPPVIDLMAALKTALARGKP